MIRNIATGLLSLGLVLGTIGPACAADGETALESTVLLPVRVAALGAGIAVGTPISVVRNTIEAFPSARDTIAGQKLSENPHPDPGQYLMADLVALPVSVATGVMLGVCDGAKNAIENCADKPFSPESFSLGDQSDSN